MANRFSTYKQEGLRYTPRTYAELSHVPYLLRERHDRVLADADEQLKDFLSKEMPDARTQAIYDRKKAELEGRIENLTTKINDRGAGDPSLLNEFRNSKRDYTQEVSKQGTVGWLHQLNEDKKTKLAQARAVAQANGMTDADAISNFQADWNEYADKSMLENADRKGYIRSDFTNTVAPKNVRPEDKFKEIQPWVEDIKKTIGNVRYEYITDSEGYVTGIKTEHGMTYDSTNLPGLGKIKNYIKELTDDEKSDVMQSQKFKYRNLTPEQRARLFREQMNPLIDANLRKETKDITTGQIQLIPQGGSGGSGGGSADKSKEAEYANLRTSPVALAKTQGTSNYAATQRELAKFEQREKNNESFTPEEAGRKDALIQQKYVVNQALANKDTKKIINDKIYKSSGGKYKTIEEAQSHITSMANLKERVDAANAELVEMQNNGTYTVNARKSINDVAKKYNLYAKDVYSNLIATSVSGGDEGIGGILEARINDLEDQYNKAFSSTVNVELLTPTRIWGFGTDDKDKELIQTLEPTINKIGSDFVNILENNKGTFNLSDDGGDIYTYGDDVKEGEEGKTSFGDGITKLRSLLGAGETKYDLVGIVDHGRQGTTQLQIGYSNKQGEKVTRGTMYVNYKLSNDPDANSTQENILNTIQAHVGPKDQGVIQAIKDNVHFSELTRDYDMIDSDEDKGYANNKTKFDKLFSTSQSQKIKDLSAASYKNIPDHSKYDIVSNPANTDKTFNIILNEDGYNELYIKGTTVGDIRQMNAGEWFNREVFRTSHTDRKMKGGAIIHGVEELKGNKSDFVRELTGLATLSQPGGAVQINENNAAYSATREQFISGINNNQYDLNAQYNLALAYYDTIKTMRIAHLNIKKTL